MNFEDFKKLKAEPDKAKRTRNPFTEDESEYSVTAYNSGYSFKEIAQELNRTDQSVKNHIEQHALKTLNAHGMEVEYHNGDT